MCPGIKRNLDALNVLLNVWSNRLTLHRTPPPLPVSFKMLPIKFFKSYTSDNRRINYVLLWFWCGMGCVGHPRLGTKQCYTQVVLPRLIEPSKWRPPDLSVVHLTLCLGLCSLESLCNIIFIKSDKLKLVLLDLIAITITLDKNTLVKMTNF